MCPISANRTVGTALFPPFMVWYQPYPPPCWRGTSFISPLLVLYQCTLEICANLLAK